MPTIITTPRPPLNLFEVVRTPITATPTEVYEVPLYRIPANGPDPARDVRTAAIMTGVMVANTSAVPITVTAQIIDTLSVAHDLLSNITVPVGDYVLLPLDRQVMLTDEILRMSCGTGQTAEVHFSFILNQRETFEVIT